MRLKMVVLPAPDMAASRRYFEGGLGFSPRFADGAHWVQYDGAGGAAFALAGPREYPAGACGAVPVWEVEDVDAEAARLRAEGFLVDAVRDMGPHGRVATLRDPAGTVIQLFGRAVPNRD